MVKCGLTHSGWYCATHKRTFPVQGELVCCAHARTQPPATSEKKPDFNSEIKISNSGFLECVGCSFLKRDFSCAIYYHCDDRARRLAAIKNGCRYQRPKRTVLHKLAQSCFIETKQLVAHTLELAGHLPMNEIEAVVGIARSGLLPATIIATQYAKPLYAYRKEGELVEVGCGNRLRYEDKDYKYKYLVLDDSVASGKQLAACLRTISLRVPPNKLLAACLYCNPTAELQPTFVYAHYQLPHFFEWNIFSCFFTREIAFDIDGILCEDPPPDCWSEGSQYEEWLINAPAKWLPQTQQGVVLISARLERYREQTTEWLNKHGVRVRRLELWSGNPEDRWYNHKAARWKAETFKELQHEYSLRYFCESDPTQAQVIASFGIKTICPALKQVFGL